MAEVLNRQTKPEHFELHHGDHGEALVCMTHDGECALLVEVRDEYSQEEQVRLSEATEQALESLDVFLGGKASELFAGLRIKIGEGLIEGGGKAYAEDNELVLSGHKMMLSIAEMRRISGAYDVDELGGGRIDPDQPYGTLGYTLVHEMGHILDGQTESGQAYSRINSSESPTKYGRESDEWHEHKDHEAFAEGFAHTVYGMPVSETMKLAVQDTIEARLAQS